MTAEIDITTSEGIQTIRFLRSDKKNAFTGEMYNAMSDALDRGATDDAVGVHLFIGSGGSFSAGNDIKDFLRRADAGDGAPAPSLDFIRRLPHVNKPMIAAVDGLAIGIGTTMLLHCDVVYASPAANLRTPFLDLGLVPEAASSLLAAQRMGHQRAFELLCLGEVFDAERAHQAGLVNAIVPETELEATAVAAAKRLLAKPQEALRAARALMKGHDIAATAAKIDEEADIFARLMSSPEAREAFAAFLEKRAPDFAKARGET